ncbi:hypothetical protein K466DRAFT_607119 [Polyporus arcularius HHB13444]|uniref:Uncharacterized protein n=1 Tax=Polyporus arcularius HHB13444 TaxID=1314778 RepID=A0A5C3NXT1_9APHY|nr:hypothetical protein K466DRAFT_607119 [Polyporus arcularius HHB13444]
MSRAAATASATLTSRADSNSSDTGSFLSSGGSTLILVFLAIGLFLGGILVMFSMRRYVVAGRRRVRTWQAAGGDWDEAHGGPATPGSVSVMMRSRRDFGQKPELWDCRVDIVEEAEDAGSGWGRIQPVAAKFVYEDEPLPSARRRGDDSLRSIASSEIRADSSSPRPAFLHRFQVGWRDFTTQLPLLHPPQPGVQLSSSPPPGSSTPDAVGQNAGDVSAAVSRPAPQTQSVRVLAAITMPTEKPCVEGVPLYALGIADVPWNGCTPDDPPPHDATPHGR